MSLKAGRPVPWTLAFLRVWLLLAATVLAVPGAPSHRGEVLPIFVAMIVLMAVLARVSIAATLPACGAVFATCAWLNRTGDFEGGVYVNRHDLLFFMSLFGILLTVVAAVEFVFRPSLRRPL